MWLSFSYDIQIATMLSMAYIAQPVLAELCVRIQCPTKLTSGILSRMYIPSPLSNAWPMVSENKLLIRFSPDLIVYKTLPVLALFWTNLLTWSMDTTR